MSTQETRSPDPSQPPVGIDLGTTYSVVAYVDSTGRPTTVLNGVGEMLTPSAILVDEEGIVIGREAARASVVEPDLYAECFKRDIGRPIFHRRIRDLEIPPEVLSAFVLERLRLDAERRLGIPIRQAVVTVPAFFDETRRKAVQDAGRLANVDVLDIINEPTAAAVAYGYQHGFLAPDAAHDSVRILVYDLGGGTFDVTVLEISGHKFRALATDGDVKLGGKDLDERLVNHLAEQFLAEHGLDPRSDPQDAAQLWLDAQEVKHTLSERTRAQVVLFHAGVRMKLDVTRDQFESLIRDLVERTGTTTSLVVKQAGLDWSEIDRVLLVGGSSRVPLVSKMLRQVSGKEPDVSASPDEVVAHGASLYAAMLMQQGEASGVAQCVLQNVNSHSLGIVGLDQRTRRRQVAVLIPKNTLLPHRATRTFRTAKENQRNVVVSVVEGESHRPEDCIAIGRCVIQDLPEGLPKGTPIEVEYSYASNGRISISARVPSVRQSAHIELERDTDRDLGQLDAWRSRLLGVAPSQSAEIAGEDAGGPSKPTHTYCRKDVLLIEIGKAALAEKLPRSLRGIQDSARVAAEDLEKATIILAKAENARQSASGRIETVQLESQLIQARTAYDQALGKSDQAYLMLGRGCITKRFHPEAAASEIREIEQSEDQSGN